MTDPKGQTGVPSVQVRIANDQDAQLLAELGARTFADTFAADNTPADLEAHLAKYFSPAVIAVELADDVNRYLIAEVGASPAGYAKLRRASHEAVDADSAVELSRIYVGQEWLSRGVGAALMQRAIDEARGWGAAVLWLGVWERNERAITFYEKWGFTKIGEHAFVLGSDRQTDWVMSRPVGMGGR
jgi:GNAT superfamily N-acetyltransferase